MNLFIKNSQSISLLDTFSKGVVNAFVEDSPQKTAVHPAYKDILKVPGMRRMTPIIKMALACGLDVADDNVEAIIVGSGLGNLSHTINFLDQIEKNTNDGPISPTQFIQSTHNTIAGQLALILQCKQYNMTHVQAGLSYETALMDAILRFENEGVNSVLVGVADELHPHMVTWGEQMHVDMNQVGEGTSFFQISNQLNEGVAVETCDVYNYKQKDAIQTFEKNVDAIVYVESGLSDDLLLSQFSNSNIYNITEKSKVYWANSGLAMHLGTELLKSQDKLGHFYSNLNSPIQTIGIINNFNNQFVGCTKLVLI